jgi:dTDP-4-dehydrorhamnose reductase
VAYPAQVPETTVAVLGGSGLVGSQVLELWSRGRNERLIAPSHADLDVLDPEAVATFVRQTQAAVVINLVAWADVDGAEAQRGNTDGRVFQLNADYPRRLAQACGESGAYLLHVSTDYVFDGTKADHPYVESDPTQPLSWYARTKQAGEQAVLASGARVCVARIAMPFTARNHPKRDFARTCLQRLQAGEPILGVVDQRITPVFLDDAVAALQLLSQRRWTGIVHVAAAEWTTPYRFARSIAARLGLNNDLVQPENFADFVLKRPARRPQHSWLDVSLFGDVFGRNSLRPLEAEVEVWVNQLQRLPDRAQIPTAAARSVRSLTGNGP